MNLWTSFLVKACLSPSLVTECRAHIPQAGKEALTERLSSTVDSPAALKNLREAVKELKPLLPAPLRAALDEEIREITDDARWAGSSRGRYVLAINEWIQPFFAEFRAQSVFSGILIGGHSHRQVVFVTGFVPSGEVFRNFMAYLHSKEPPFKVMIDIRIGAWNGPRAGE